MADGVVWMIRFSNGRFAVTDDFDRDDYINPNGTALCQWMDETDALRSAHEIIEKNKAIGLQLKNLEVVAVAYGCVPLSGRQNDIKVIQVN